MELKYVECIDENNNNSKFEREKRMREWTATKGNMAEIYAFLWEREG